MCHGECHPINNSTGGGDIVGDEQERAPAPAHVRAQTIEERGVGELPCIPNDEGAGIRPQSEPKGMFHLLPARGTYPKKMGQVDPGRRRRYGVKSRALIEKQHRGDAGCGGKQAMQERRDSAPALTGKEMHRAQGEAVEGGIERRETRGKNMQYGRRIESPTKCGMRKERVMDRWLWIQQCLDWHVNCLHPRWLALLP